MAFLHSKIAQEALIFPMCVSEACYRRLYPLAAQRETQAAEPRPAGSTRSILVTVPAFFVRIALLR